ncbi:hypothetical protein [Sphingobium baderi]|uniref:Uncharacterized protein n=1 Tax=Sphingobium baderi TaxID=1332080 RepID=A0A0S3F2V7_9SPHN|nr:hypothetical protein [Sphingobium baderi]ALR22065.1 hypothetical protein ATN00_18900 [Sphingobium baderi]
MNDTTLANNHALVASIDTDELERAIADMEVAMAFTDAIETFIEQARGFTSGRELCREAKSALVMLTELHDRLRVTDDRLMTLLRQIAAVQAAARA